MKKRSLIATLLLLGGCTASAVDAPRTTSTTSGPVESPQLPPLPGMSSEYTAFDPAVVLQLQPASPCEGQQVTVTGRQAPPEAALSLWLTPPIAGGFKNGLFHPQAVGKKLGEARSDASGQFRATFTMPPNPFPPANVRPQGEYALWVVADGLKAMSPMAALWGCGNPTRFSGAVFDEKGQPILQGANVRLRVLGSFQAQAEPLFDQTADVVDGRYAFERVPAPGLTEFTVTREGWPARQRWESYSTIESHWGATDAEVVAHYNAPLIFNFGGPSAPEDPLGPAYFLSKELAAARVPLRGKIYDLDGRQLPLMPPVELTVSSLEGPPYSQKLSVQGGAYSLEQVPTGVRLSFDLRLNPLFPLPGFSQRTEVLIPPQVSGRPCVVNFGGPATPEDPEAPRHPFPSPQAPNPAPSPFIPRP